MNEIRPVIFGEVLFDIFQDGSVVLGGAPFNVAWHLQAFGINPLFISRIGKDSLGEKIIKRMTKWKMDLSAIQHDVKHDTGTVQVILNRDEPSFNIVQDCAYDFIDADKIPAVPNNSIIYHGSLALRNIISSRALDKLLLQASGSVFVDVNLRPPWYESEKIVSIMEHAKWIKLNEQELREITKQDNENNVIISAQYLQKKMNVDVVIITQGAKGAFAIGNQGEVFEVCPDKKVDVIDSVGAGDAFSSVCILGLIKGWNLLTTMKRAQQFASEIVSQRGATVNDMNLYSTLINDWSLH